MERSARSVGMQHGNYLLPDFYFSLTDFLDDDSAKFHPTIDFGTI